MQDFDNLESFNVTKIVVYNKQYSDSALGKQIKEWKIDYVMFSVWERALS